MQEYQHTVTAIDGVKLFVREYLPEGPAPRRNLLFIHGACEHGGRYRELAEAATAAGWRLLIPDHRGHGLSGGIRVHVASFEEYLDDMRLHCRHFSLLPGRTAIIGHSMGGLVLARLLESNTHLATAACLLSPYLGLQIRVDRWTLFVGKILASVWPWYRFRSRVRADDLSPDPEYLARRRQDPLIERNVTAGWFFVVQQALREVHDEVARVHTPLLVVQGDQDRIVNPQATVDWFQKISSNDRQLEVLRGHLHELLQETDRQQTTQMVLEWLGKRIGDRSPESVQLRQAVQFPNDPFSHQQDAEGDHD